MLPKIENKISLDKSYYTKIENLLLNYNDWDKTFKLKSNGELEQNKFTLEKRTRNFMSRSNYSSEITGDFRDNTISYAIKPTAIAKLAFVSFPIVYPFIIYDYISSNSNQIGQLLGLTIAVLGLLGYHYFKIKKDMNEMNLLFREELLKLEQEQTDNN